MQERLKERNIIIWTLIFLLIVLYLFASYQSELISDLKKSDFSNVYANLTVDSGEEISEFCRNEGYQGGWIETRPRFSIKCYTDYGTRTEYYNYKLKECRF